MELNNNENVNNVEQSTENAEMLNNVESAAGNGGMPDNDGFERIDKFEYSDKEVFTGIVQTVFPFINPKKRYFASAIAFALTASFFLIPAILSLLSLIIGPRFANGVASNTKEFIGAFSNISIVFLAWFVLGKIIQLFIPKDSASAGKFLGKYDGILDFFKHNVVRILMVVVMIIMIVASYLNEGNRHNAFNNLTDGIFGYLRMACGCICAMQITVQKQKRWAVTALAVSGFIMAFFVYYQYVTLYKSVVFEKAFTTDFSVINPPAIRIRQMRGIFANSNHCGYFMVMGTLATAGLLISAKRVWQKVIYGIMLAVTLNITVLNDTMGSVFAVILLMILLPVAFIKSKHSIVSRFVPLVIMIAVFAFITCFPKLPTGTNNLKNYYNDMASIVRSITGNKEASEGNTTPSNDKKDVPAIVARDLSTAASDSAGLTAESTAVSDRIESSQVVSEIVEKAPEVTPEPVEAKTEENRWWLKNQSVGTNRLGLWQYGIELVRHKPWLGYGCNGTEVLFEKESGLAEPAARVHNEYLQVAIDYGIPAMVIYLVALFTTVGYFFNRLRRNKLTDNGRMLFVIFAGYCVSAFTGISAYYTACFYLLVFALLITEFEGKELVEADTTSGASSAATTETEDMVSDEIANSDVEDTNSDELV